MHIGESPGLTVGVKLSGVPFGTVPYADTLWRVPQGFPDGRRRCKDGSPNLSGKRTEHKEHDFLYFMLPFIYFRLRSFGFVSRLFVSDYEGGWLWILLHC